jgi:hypothetical protein
MCAVRRAPGHIADSARCIRVGSHRRERTAST